MEVGSVVLTVCNPDRVFEGLRLLELQGREEDRTTRIPKDYDVPNVSEKVARIILSYTDYVNRSVWHKDSLQ
jgi:UDP-N-acetylglucosamine 2-epimerase